MTRHRALLYLECLAAVAACLLIASYNFQFFDVGTEQSFTLGFFAKVDNALDPYMYDISQTTPSHVSNTSFASANEYYQSSPPGRLALAVRLAVELHCGGHLELIHCPDAHALGARPSSHTVAMIGNLCEPWLNRQTLTVLSHVLDQSMVGLEWSSGSGTIWLLRRLRLLYTVEHCGPWLDSVRKKVADTLPWKAKWWIANHVLPAAGDCNNTPGSFKNYVSYPTLHFSSQHPTGFDFISVDGRARSKCVHEVLNNRLLKPYGLLLVDNAERPAYHDAVDSVPDGWLTVSFQNVVSESAIWMSCPRGDGNCHRAQDDINAALSLIRESQGSAWKRKFRRRMPTEHNINVRCYHAGNATRYMWDVANFTWYKRDVARQRKGVWEETVGVEPTFFDCAADILNKFPPKDRNVNDRKG
eukprot:CAMPEP_0180615122 /NCGR_PEP_ID=MMETSP1037_2-20121125/31780_1 /TAXON_ID=632150 /ORGANISM="Azadinium spinosum, Strain 3D9" /LENGTH=414 /DNA_ID=CAMNT_0022634877 /DNA_START=1 /DNA_END=1242 /DNA_ORIENTATION=+